MLYHSVVVDVMDQNLRCCFIANLIVLSTETSIFIIGCVFSIMSTKLVIVPGLFGVLIVLG